MKSILINHILIIIIYHIFLVLVVGCNKASTKRPENYTVSIYKSVYVIESTDLKNTKIHDSGNREL